MLETELSQRHRLLERSDDDAALSHDQPRWTHNPRRGAIFKELSMDHNLPRSDYLAASQHSIGSNRQRRSWPQTDRTFFKIAFNLNLRFLVELENGVT